LLKKRNAAEKTKTRTAAIVHNNKTMIRSVLREAEEETARR
jgi:hypothetical protein